MLEIWGTLKVSADNTRAQLPARAARELVVRAAKLGAG